AKGSGPSVPLPHPASNAIKATHHHFALMLTSLFLTGLSGIRCRILPLSLRISYVDDNLRGTDQVDQNDGYRRPYR
ncbi:MAG: hypothetical protein WBV56_05545, partial [Azonexus sp.]